MSKALNATMAEVMGLKKYPGLDIDMVTVDLIHPYFIEHEKYHLNPEKYYVLVTKVDGVVVYKSWNPAEILEQALMCMEEFNEKSIYRISVNSIEGRVKTWCLRVLDEHYNEISIRHIRFKTLLSKSAKR